MSFSENDAIVVNGVSVDQKNEIIITSLSTKRKKKAFLDITMNLAVAFDSPYYF